MKFIYGYPELTGIEGDLLDAGEVGEVAAAAERAGFEGFALTEHPIPGANWLAHGGHQTLDPFIGLSFAAAVTTRLRLLTFLAVVPYRNPFMLAKTAATLDRLSNGRLILGVGTGYQKSEYFALGVDIDERNALFDEALEVMPLAWSGERFSYKGIHFDARDVIAKPKPAQDPIPIWIGGNAKITRRRVAEKAQGWMPLGGLGGVADVARTARTPNIEGYDELKQMIAELRENASGRAAHIDVCVGLTDHSIWDLTDTARHADGLAALEAAGVDWVHVEGPSAPAPAAVDFAAGFGVTYING